MTEAPTSHSLCHQWTVRVSVAVEWHEFCFPNSSHDWKSSSLSLANLTSNAFCPVRKIMIFITVKICKSGKHDRSSIMSMCGVTGCLGDAWSKEGPVPCLILSLSGLWESCHLYSTLFVVTLYCTLPGSNVLYFITNFFCVCGMFPSWI